MALGSRFIPVFVWEIPDNRKGCWLRGWDWIQSKREMH